MPILIDGYNLLNVAGVMPAGRGPGTLEKARQALLNVLVESLPADEVARTTVVFDASDSPWGVAKQSVHRGIAVLFAAKDTDADTLIEELIKADSAPKRLTVVSSDHRIQRAAKRRRSTAVDSDVWFANLLRERAARTNTGADLTGKTPDVAKPQGPFAPGEVDYWLRMFELDD
jgi:predicted RNA-binding protein with PIN domain